MQRLNLIRGHLEQGHTARQARDTLTVTDNRTGKTYELDVKDSAIIAKEFGKIKGPDGSVTRYYDPGYTNTVNCVRKSFLTLSGLRNLFH